MLPPLKDAYNYKWLHSSRDWTRLLESVTNSVQIKKVGCTAAEEML